MTTDNAPALGVTGNPQVGAHLLDIASQRGVPLTVTDEVPAPATYTAAPVVLLGTDRLHLIFRARLPVHSALIIIAVDVNDTTVWHHAAHVAASYVVFLPTAAVWLGDLLAARLRPMRVVEAIDAGHITDARAPQGGGC